jgi:hypothetical protein
MRGGGKDNLRACFFALINIVNGSLVAKHMDLFDDVMASNKHFNLSSHNKAYKLVERFGEQGFDYIGDHMRDLPVWQASNLAILVNVSTKVIRKTQHLNTLILSKKNNF